MRPPDRSTIMFTVALVATTLWIVTDALGLHPDGAILGFSGTMWAVWATSEKEVRRRDQRLGRGGSRRSPPTERRRPARKVAPKSGKKAAEDEGENGGGKGKDKPWLG